jgi:hypothetical protein
MQLQFVVNQCYSALAGFVSRSWTPDAEVMQREVYPQIRVGTVGKDKYIQMLCSIYGEAQQC